MTAPKRATRSRPETLLKRQEILKAAVEIFGNKGSANGTLADIAEQVGMTHAGVLHHFGSKDQLLLEAVRYRDRNDLETVQLEHMPEGIEFFNHLIATAFQNAQRAGLTQVYAVLSAESVTDEHPAKEYFIDRYRTLRDDAVKAFQLICKQRGVEAPETVAQASASIFAVMDGLQVQWLLDPERLDLGETTKFAINAIVAAVLIHSPQNAETRPPQNG